MAGPVNHIINRVGHLLAKWTASLLRDCRDWNVRSTES